MLKHTGPPSSTTAVPAAGQLRINTNTSGRGGIHLRQPQQPQQQQQQPLNISTLSCTNLPAPITLTTTTTTTPSLTNNISNGGQRIPTLLNIDYATIPSGIAATSAAAISAAAGSTAGSTTIATVLPPTATANGIASNLHIYSNQQQQYVSSSSHNSHHQLHHPQHHHPYNSPTLSLANNLNTSLLPIPNCNNTTANNNNNNSNTGTNMTKTIHNYQQQKHHQGHGPGPREALTSLGLLCLVSLLLALLSLIFLLKISPNDREDVLTRSTDDFVVVYDVTVALCALSLSLNLCCLLVCAIQFLFAVKLVRSPSFDGRDNKYLEKSSTSRTCAVGGFFISIPIFLTGIILYTFNHFHSTPAIITSVLIGIGIVFCGGAMVHNVFIWQKEKTISYRSPPAPGSAAAAAALLTLPAHMNSITVAPPVPPHFTNHTNHLIYNQQQPPTQAASVTPVSPNHSHGSFCPLAGGPFNSSFMIRPATATPPTPRPPNGCVNMNGREASGSVSPGLPPTLDMSNITSTSLHELSTLV